MGKTIGLILSLKDECTPRLKKIADKIGITEKEAKKLDNQINQLSKDLGGKLKGACTAIGAGIAVAIGSMSTLAVKAGETCDRIDDLSNKIGISRQGFQEWDYLLGQNGANIESLQMGMKTLVNQIDGVTKGNKNSIATFKALGVSVKNSSGRLKNQEQVFNEVVSALQKMPEGARKAKIANDLLGRSGSELMPLFNQNIEVFKKQREEYRKLGLTISDEVIDAGNEFGDNLEKLKSVGSSYGAVIGGTLLPVLNDLAKKLIVELPKIRDSLLPVFNALSSTIRFVVEHFRALSITAGVMFGVFAMVNVINATATAFDTLCKISSLLNSVGGIGNLIKMKSITLHNAERLAIIAKTLSLNAYCGIVALTTSLSTAQGRAMMFSAMAQKVATVGQWALNVAMNACPFVMVITAIGAVVAGLVWLAKNWEKVTEWVNKTITALKNFINLKLPKKKAEVEITKTETTNEKIKKNALGTSFSTGGTTLVGEHGAELVNLPRGASVMNANNTAKALSGSRGINVNIVIQGNMVGNSEFLNKMAGMFAQKLQVALAVR